MDLLGIDEAEVYEYRRQKEVKLASYTRQIREKDDAQKIPVRTQVGYVDLYLYRPATDPCAVVFNFHGGGFVLGYWELDAPYCRMLADRAQAAVVNVDYKVAPEYKFPLPQETTFEALTRFAAHAGEFGLADLPIIVGGSSAGGCLTAGIAQMDELRGRALNIAGIYMNYPALKQQLAERPALDASKAIATSRLTQYISWAFDSLDQLDDPLASPLLSEGVRYPATLMNIAGFDSLREEAEAFARKLEAAGTPVDYHCFEGCMHGFTHRDLKEFDPQASELAWERIVRFIRERAAAAIAAGTDAADAADAAADAAAAGEAAATDTDAAPGQEFAMPLRMEVA